MFCAKNINTQHTEMRGHLQERHEQMANDINEFTAKVGNNVGQYMQKYMQTSYQHHKLILETLGADITEADTVDTFDDVSTPVVTLVIQDSFQEFKGKCCRTSTGDRGSNGIEYDEYNDLSHDECGRKCLFSSFRCYGWEYVASNNYCEIWKVPIDQSKLGSAGGCECNVALEYAITVDGGAFNCKEGSKITALAPDYNNNNQRFRIENGTIWSAMCSGMVVGVENEGTCSVGTNVTLRKETGTRNQQWTFIDGSIKSVECPNMMLNFVDNVAVLGQAAQAFKQKSQGNRRLLGGEKSQPQLPPLDVHWPNNGGRKIWEAIRDIEQGGLTILQEIKVVNVMEARMKEVEANMKTVKDKIDVVEGKIDAVESSMEEMKVMLSQMMKMLK
eukprot:scaffold47880_cov66-Cyclotella_meneghiniana.AAC.3